MADHGVVCSMSRCGNAWDNAAMENLFSFLKTEGTVRNVHREMRSSWAGQKRFNDSPVVGFSGVRQLCSDQLATMIYPPSPTVLALQVIYHSRSERSNPPKSICLQGGKKVFFAIGLQSNEKVGPRSVFVF